MTGSDLPSSTPAPRSLNRHAGRCVLSALLLAVLLLIPADSTFAARGHEFGLVVGWGVSNGEPKLETCSRKCQPGIAGSGKGQFDAPYGVAVNEASGDFYVADEANGRVERFGAKGEYLGFFDGSGRFEVEEHEEADAEPPTGKLLLPKTIAVDNSCFERKLTLSECSAQDPSAGNVYVGDFGHEVIDKFSAAGEYIGQLHVPPGVGVELLGLAVDANGNLWVAEGQVSQEGFDEFDDAVDNGHVKFVKDDNVRFRGPRPELAIGREGNLFATTVFESPFNEVIRKFTPDGTLLGIVARERSTGVGVEWTSGDIYIDTGTSLVRLTPALPSHEIERFGDQHLIEGTGVAINARIVPKEAIREGPVYVADTGAADVVVFPLEIPKKPSIEESSVADVTAESAVLRALVNPRGAQGEYRFEYGTCSSSSACKSTEFEARAPSSGDALVGAPQDFEGHAVSVHPQDLRPDTFYHFRIAIRNDINEPGEYVESQEVVFKTQPAVPVESLLDSRAWELVSPPHKHGTLIRQILAQDVIQASVDGTWLTYMTDTPTEDEPQGFSNLVQVLAHRTSTSWVSEDIGLPHTRATGQSVGQGEEYRMFSEDLSAGMVQPLGSFEPGVSADATEQTPYLRTDFTGQGQPCKQNCYQPLVSSANVREGVRFGEEGLCPPHVICGPVIVGASPDGHHVILRSTAGLTEGLGEKGGLYEWTNGLLSPVSILPPPNEKPASLASGPVLGGAGVTRGAVSLDGSSVVWSASAGKGLYVRNMESGKSVEINEGIPGVPVFQAASADGSKVFFTDGGGDLYVYETENGETTRLTVPLEAGEETRIQGQIAGISQDGTYVYFVANGRLNEAAKAGPGTCNGAGSSELARCYLYEMHETAGVWSLPRVVAVLSGLDFPDFSSGLPEATVRVSPNGGWLVFMSQMPLTGYNNHDAVSGVPDEEVFLFDDASGSTVCVSCNPTGSRPAGVEVAQLVGGLAAGFGGWRDSEWLAGNVPGWTPYATGQAFYQSRYLLDDGRVFFNSSDSLVAGDVNGTEDVYEFEPAGVGSCSAASLTFGEDTGGCIALVSSGTSRQESAFLDASGSGGDVFFLTASQLLSSDFDSALDVYDARECTVVSLCLPALPNGSAPCTTEASCKEAPSAQPELFGMPPSSTFTGLGNVGVLSSAGTRATLTQAQLRTKALNSCRRRYRHARRKRQACERRVQAKHRVKSGSSSVDRLRR